jgi:hypothetical protein
VEFFLGRAEDVLLDETFWLTQLRAALEENAFSDIRTEKPTLATSAIVTAVRSS